MLPLQGDWLILKVEYFIPLSVQLELYLDLLVKIKFQPGPLAD